MWKFWRVVITVLHYIWIALLVYLGIQFLYNIIMASKNIDISYIPFWLMIGLIVLNIPYIMYKNKIKKK